MGNDRKFIVDSDLNFPSDDFQALLLLISNAPGRLVGVSACAGNTFAEECFVNIAHALEICGRTDVLLAPGANYEQFVSRRKAAVADWECGRIPFIGSFQKAKKPRFSYKNPEFHDVIRQFDVVGSLLEMLDAQTEVVDIICLGPLTNLAEALRIRPAIAEKIGMVWIMGGNISVSPESTRFDFNFWYDPWSACDVVNSTLTLRIFPYELCRQDRSSACELLQTKVSGLAEIFVEDLDLLVRQHGIEMPLCDQLVAVGYLYPEVLQDLNSVQIAVSFSEDHFFGSSFALPSASSQISMVTRVRWDQVNLRLKELLQNMHGTKLKVTAKDFTETSLYRIDSSV